MVYLPSSYLLSAAIAAIGLQIQQTKAESMYYEPMTVSGALHTLDRHFPGYGANILDEDCAFTVEIDPTLPDITTIQNAPVVYMDLLANTSVPPVEPVFTKVGKVIMSEEIDTTRDDAGKGDKSGAKDCATGWEETTAARKLGDSVVSGHALDEKMETVRRLEASSSQDLATLEAHFGFKFEKKLANLPTEGSHTPVPWAGGGWATFRDSLNFAWQKGQPSPAEKYARAFGLDVKFFMNRVSRILGIDAYSFGLKCQTQDTCETLQDRSVCAMRANATSGYCIPKWYGVCHALAAAAILEPEPNCPVTYNGVTFQPMDIKGLITSIYDSTNVPSIYTGARYNSKNTSTDEYGRHLDAAYRDINPAFFHIVTANLLGLHNTTFIVDTDPGEQIWNQPVRSFKVVEQTALSLKEAAQSFYGLLEYPWNAAAKSIVYIKLRLSWIRESYKNEGLVSLGRSDEVTFVKYYYYLLELDALGFIIGGEWVYISSRDHPDFIWVPIGKPAANSRTNTGLSYANVRMLMEKSVACTDSA